MAIQLKAGVPAPKSVAITDVVPAVAGGMNTQGGNGQVVLKSGVPIPKGASVTAIVGANPQQVSG